MKISVIIPHFNQTRFLKMAIDSVIAQTHVPYEIIVVDDDSTDELHDFFKTHGQYVRFFQQNKAGSSAARNLGIQKAQSDYIAFLDADDKWHPEKLNLQIQSLEKNPQQMIFSHVENFLCETLSENQKKIFARNLNKPLIGIIPSSLLIARHTLLEIGLMNEQIQMGEFIEWYIRAQQLGIKTNVVKQTLVFRRIHAGHIGKSHLHQDYLKILHQKIKQKIS